ncbi:unnamed protein product [Sphagnum jensenii]|uniref:Uncharacterized protein n=1 Tax=Sphagnum jensenii TaxID=128206 RepID=A0ABP0WZ62_9BRYO
MKRGAAGVAFGKPPHVLDAANLVNIAWNEISSQCLKNCFKKADILSSFRGMSEVNSDSDDLDEIVELFQNCSILRNSDDLNIRDEVQQCIDDDNDQSDFCKNVLIEEIEEAMGQALVLDSHSDVDDSGFGPDEVITDSAAIDQREVIDCSLQDVIGLEVRLHQLEESTFLTSEQIHQAKSALFTLRRVLQSGHSAITREAMRNSRQLTLFDLMH